MRLDATHRVRITLAITLLLLACAVFASTANAATIGIIPPSNPKQNCVGSSDDWTLDGIDRCRALEGVGPLIRPSNWSRLTMPQRMLVIIDLERVNRGLAPVVGLAPALDALAQTGAEEYTDPSFPTSSSFNYGGSIWGETGSVIEADYGWMYDDGYTPDGPAVNIDCLTPDASGCWGHRDVILMNRSSTIVGGGGYTDGDPDHGSYAFEMLAGYSTKKLAFTWTSERRYFTVKPGLEPLTKPTVRSLSPAHGVTTGGLRVTITGTELQSLTAVSFGGIAGNDLNCTSNEQCTVRTPPHVAGKVSVVAENAAGKSRASKAATFTYVVS